MENQLGKKVYMIISLEKLIINLIDKSIDFTGEVASYGSGNINTGIAYENEDYFVSLLNNCEEFGKEKISINKHFEIIKYQEDKHHKLIYIIMDDLILFSA